jgi:hypothetical protein
MDVEKYEEKIPRDSIVQSQSYTFAVKILTRFL